MVGTVISQQLQNLVPFHAFLQLQNLIKAESCLQGLHQQRQQPTGRGPPAPLPGGGMERRQWEDLPKPLPQPLHRTHNICRSLRDQTWPAEVSIGICGEREWRLQMVNYSYGIQLTEAELQQMKPGGSIPPTEGARSPRTPTSPSPTAKPGDVGWNRGARSRSHPGQSDKLSSVQAERLGRHTCGLNPREHGENPEEKQQYLQRKLLNGSCPSLQNLTRWNIAVLAQRYFGAAAARLVIVEFVSWERNPKFCSKQSQYL